MQRVKCVFVRKLACDLHVDTFFFFPKWIQVEQFGSAPEMYSALMPCGL